MSTSAQQWIEHELDGVALGDARLDARFASILVDLTRRCGKTLSRSFASRAAMKAAYRFFDNARVTVNAMLAPHVRRTVERVRMSDAGTVLLVQDTTTLNFAGRAKTSGLDVINTGSSGEPSRGLLLHNTLALTDSGLPLGLVAQSFVDRKTLRSQALVAERTDEAPIRDKESYRWIQTLRATHALDFGDKRIVHVGDREADIYELFRDAAELGAHVLVRASANRVIDKAHRADKPGCWLFDDLMKRRAQGTTTVRIQVNKTRKFRTAKLSIIYRRISLPAPSAKRESRDGPLPMIDLTAVMAIEKSAPSPREKLCWVLLTDLPVQSLDEAIETVDWYSRRWAIEVFHKVLKSGCKVEDAQLGDAENLKRYVIAKSLVAWRLFWLRHLTDHDPDGSCETVLERDEWVLLYRRTHKTRTAPKTAPTVSEALLWIAKLGGYLDRRSDPGPGVISLWRGWERLTDMVDDYRAICGES